MKHFYPKLNSKLQKIPINKKIISNVLNFCANVMNKT